MHYIYIHILNLWSLQSEGLEDDNYHAVFSEAVSVSLPVRLRNMARFALVGMMLESRKDPPAWWMGDGAWMVGTV